MAHRGGCATKKIILHSLVIIEVKIIINFNALEQPRDYDIAHLQQKCHNSKFGIFESLV